MIMASDEFQQTSLINIGSSDGLMSSGNKPLPEPVLTKFYKCYIALQGHKVLNKWVWKQLQIWSSLFKCTKDVIVLCSFWY